MNSKRPKRSSDLLRRVELAIARKASVVVLEHDNGDYNIACRAWLTRARWLCMDSANGQGGATDFAANLSRLRPRSPRAVACEIHVGYALHTISDLIGLFALLLLLGTAAYLRYRGIVDSFRASLLWLLLIPFGLAIVGWILYRLSWVVAHRRGFHYDHESREASWQEDGQRRTYKYNDAA
jgi:hypothetical protein